MGENPEGRVPPTNYGLNTVSNEAKDLLRSLLEVDPQAVVGYGSPQHPWIQSDSEMKPSVPLKTAHEALKA